MIKKKVLLCGNQKSFSRLLKHKFEDVLNIELCRDFKEADVQLNVYQAIVIVTYREEDFLDFFKVYERKIPLAVCCFNKPASDTLKNDKNVFFIDTSKVKSQIVSQLSVYFEKNVLNSQNLIAS
ncbi:hypothetical protein [Flavobacterium denitrificans]|uniref:hypothetical protein n=1 Tax=Flavobacterium denitrificans TaxID=281361 RepID=UPI00042843F8|nr:hypothetical protein [Flavobacterium denitrificans]